MPSRSCPRGACRRPRAGRRWGTATPRSPRRWRPRPTPPRAWRAARSHGGSRIRGTWSALLSGAVGGGINGCRDAGVQRDDEAAPAPARGVLGVVLGRQGLDGAGQLGREGRALGRGGEGELGVDRERRDRLLRPPPPPPG